MPVAEIAHRPTEVAPTEKVADQSYTQLFARPADGAGLYGTVHLLDRTIAELTQAGLTRNILNTQLGQIKDAVAHDCFSINSDFAGRGASLGKLYADDLRSLIEQKQLTGDRTLTILQVGVGNQYQESLDLLEHTVKVFHSEVPALERSQWKVTLITSDYQRWLADRAMETCIEKLKALDPAGNIVCRSEAINALSHTDVVKLSKLFAEIGSAPDYIVHRNVSNINAAVAGGIFSQDNLDNPELPRMLNAYGQTQLLLSQLAVANTRYIVDQIAWNPEMHAVPRSLQLPGAVVMGFNGSLPSDPSLNGAGASLQAIRESGTGFYRISDPAPVRTMSLRDFMEFNK